MILDGHVHIRGGKEDRAEFLGRLASAGIDGALVIAGVPPTVCNADGADTAAERLDKLFFWTDGHPDLYPFFWIDPIQDSALEQVGMAVERGAMGFKIMCARFYPRDERAMRTVQAIAHAGKPILFHSGILWDGMDSTRFNRPGEFEALAAISGLRFCLAHVSWPWYDECIGVFGKFLATAQNAEMFIDVTPGTPRIYREEVLRKLFTVGYDVEHSIIFGTDGQTNDYNASWAREWIDRDTQIYSELALGDETVDNVFAENLRRFVGVSEAPAAEKRRPKVGE